MAEENFVDTLPEEVKAHFTEEDRADENISKYKTVPDFIKGHRNLATMISAKGVIIPKDDASEEEWGNFHNALGRPEKADGYKLDEIKDLHKDIKITPEGLKSFLDFSHTAGLTNKQVNLINKYYLAKVTEQLTANDILVEKETKEWSGKVEAGATELKNEWQADYAKKIATAQAAIKKFGGEGILEALGEAATKPAVLRMFANVGANFTEDELKSLGTTQTSGNADVLKKIKEIQDAPKTGEKAHPVWNEKDPKHEEAVKEYHELYKKAYGEESTAT